MCAGDFRSIRNDRSACEGFCILQAFPIRHWIERSILLRRMWRFGMTCESLVMSYLEDSTFRRHQENWKNHWLPLEYIWHCPLWCTSVGHFSKALPALSRHKLWKCCPQFSIKRSQIRNNGWAEVFRTFLPTLSVLQNWNLQDRIWKVIKTLQFVIINFQRQHLAPNTRYLGGYAEASAR